MIEASCHCGTVRIAVPHRPERLTSCNCSICRRLGVLWAYFDPRAVRFLAGDGVTIAYSHGDRTLAFHHCPTCGCTTHWRGFDPDAERMAVNARLMPPQEIEGVRIRRFDGAESWTYLD